MCKFESSEKEESRAQSAAPRRPTAGFFISRFLRRKKTGKNLNSIPGSREKNGKNNNVQVTIQTKSNRQQYLQVFYSFFCNSFAEN